MSDHEQLPNVAAQMAAAGTLGPAPMDPSMTVPPVTTPLVDLLAACGLPFDNVADDFDRDNAMRHAATLLRHRQGEIMRLDGVLSQAGEAADRMAGDHAAEVAKLQDEVAGLKKKLDEQMWQHGQCLHIAEGASLWELETTNDSPAMVAVRKLLHERMDLQGMWAEQKRRAEEAEADLKTANAVIAEDGQAFPPPLVPTPVLDALVARIRDEVSGINPQHRRRPNTGENEEVYTVTLPAVQVLALVSGGR